MERKKCESSKGEEEKKCVPLEKERPVHLGERHFTFPSDRLGRLQDHTGMHRCGLCWFSKFGQNMLGETFYTFLIHFLKLKSVSKGLR